MWLEPSPDSRGQSPHTHIAPFTWKSLMTKFWHDLFKEHPSVVTGCVAVGNLDEFVNG